VNWRRALAGCERSGKVRDALAATGFWDEVWSADTEPSETPVMTFVAAEDRWVNVPDRPEDGPRVRHYQGDVRDLFKWSHPVNRTRRWASKGSDLAGRLGFDSAGVPLWDFAMLHPPCDHLSQAGAVWWKHKDATRGGDGRMQEGAAFFMQMVKAPAKYVAVENPVGVMGLPKQACYYRRPDQTVQPYWFGDPVAKATCLWLKNLPPLVPDQLVEPSGRVATGGGSWRTDQKNGRGANNGHEDGEGRRNRKIVRSRTLPGFARAVAEQWTAFIAEQEKEV
jgi:hypothetical protein